MAARHARYSVGARCSASPSSCPAMRRGCYRRPVGCPDLAPSGLVIVPCATACCPLAAQLLAPQARALLFDPPTNRDEALSRCALAPENLALARRHSGTANQIISASSKAEIQTALAAVSRTSVTIGSGQVVGQDQARSARSRSPLLRRRVIDYRVATTSRPRPPEARAPASWAPAAALQPSAAARRTGRAGAPRLGPHPRRAASHSSPAATP